MTQSYTLFVWILSFDYWKLFDICDLEFVISMPSSKNS